MGTEANLIETRSQRYPNRIERVHPGAERDILPALATVETSMQLHHVNIKAPAELLEREKRFFCEVLNLREGSRPDFDSAGYWLYAGDNAIVHLSVSERNFNHAQPRHVDHVAFQSQDLAALVRRLKEAGIDYRADFVDACEMTQVFIESPTGTGIEVNFVGESI